MSSNCKSCCWTSCAIHFDAGEAAPGRNALGWGLRSGPAENDPEGPDDEAEVETQAPAIDVVEIEAHPVVEWHLVAGCTDLPEACETGPDGESAAPGSEPRPTATTTEVASWPPAGILVSSSALPVAPSAVSAAIRSISSVVSVSMGPSWPWNTPMTRASASVVVGADWLVSKVTVILLIVGHRPVFQPGPSGDLLCPPQTAPRLRTNRDLRLFRVTRPGHLSGFTQYDDGVYSGSAVRLVHA